jgi:metal-responsive CopG/Arc/MetJ family transcriptional regulator
MPALSLRLPEELEQRLDEEARQEGVPRSEVARAAISDYLARRERERFMAELVAEARSAYANDQIRDEALAIAENFLLLDEEATPTSGKANDNEGWWK